MHDFGKRLSSLLNKRSLTITAIAKELGISRQAIYKWIRVGGISAENTQKLAQLLEVNPAWLRYGDIDATTLNRRGDPDDTWSTTRSSLIERLIKSEQSLRITLDIAKVATWEYSIATDQITFGEEIRRHFGITTENTTHFTRKQFLKLIHPDDRQAYEQTLINLMLGVPENQTEIRLLKPDKSIAWVTAWTIRNEDDKHSCQGLFGALQDITDRKQAEIKLQQAQNNLVNAQQIAHLGSWEWTISDDQAHWSDEMYRIFGVNKEDYTPSYYSFLNMLQPSDRDQLIHCLSSPRNSSTCEKSKREFQITTENGSVKYIQIDGVLHLDELGTPTRMIGSVLDITQRKEYEMALEQSEYRLQQLKEKLPIAIIVSNSQGEILDCNPYCAVMFGYTTTEQAIGHSVYQHYINKQDRSVLLEQLKEGPISDHNIQFKRVDGTLFWGSLSATMIVEGNEDRMFSSVTDVTLKLATKKALAASENRYRSLFELASTPVFLETPEGEILDCNHQACALYGYSKKEFIGMNVKQLVPREIAENLDAMSIQQLEEGGLNIQVKQIKKDGSEFTAEVRTKLFYTDETPNVMVTVTEIKC